MTGISSGKERRLDLFHLRSFRFKMTLYYAFILVGLIVLFSGTVLAFFTYFQINSMNRSLEESSSRVAFHLANQGIFFIDSEEYLVLRGTWSLLHLDFQIYDEGLNAHVGGTGKLHPGFALSPVLVGRLLRQGQQPRTVNLLEQDFAPRSLWLLPWQNPPGHSLIRVTWQEIRLPARSYYVVVGMSLDNFLAARSQIAHVMVVTAALAGLAALFLGHRAAGRAIEPLTTINRLISQVSIDNLDLRLPLEGADREIAELALHLNEMLDKLERSVHQLKQFTSDVSHELRTPIAVVRGKIEVSLLKERDPDYYRRSLGEISKQVANMQNMVEVLLELARLDALSGLEETEPVDLCVIAEEVADNMAPILSERAQKLQLDLDMAPLEGRQGLILRLATNLLDNASKYTPEGKALGIRTTTDENTGKAILEVWDSGPGMDSEGIRRCFDRFWRADRARSTPGYGLGLTLVQRVAQLHQATMEIDAKPGQGTTFRILFPVDRKTLEEYRQGWDSDTV